jgi:hypothetical protein
MQTCVFYNNGEQSRGLSATMNDIVSATERERELTFLSATMERGD